MPSLHVVTYFKFLTFQKLTLAIFSCSRQNFAINAGQVNTLSAKADSFLEHLAQRQGYAPLARSRPGALKDVERSVLVPIKHQPTVAAVKANSQTLGHVGTTATADLTGVARGHFSYFTSGPFSLECEHFDEARPGNVGNRPGKPAVLDHASHVQAFHSDPAVAGKKVIGNSVPVFVPQIGDPGVQSAELQARFSAIAATFLFARQRTLGATQNGQLGFEEPRIGNPFAIRSRDKVRQAEIKANRREGILNFGSVGKLTCDNHKPFTTFAFQAERLDLAFHFPVQADANCSCMLDSQSVAGEPDTIPVARVKNRIEPLARLEPRVAWLFTVLNAPEEVGKSFIQAPQRPLSAAEIDSRKVRILQTLFLVPAGLITVVARDLPLVVEPLALRQCIIVKPSVCFQGDTKLTLLVSVCPESELIGFELHPRFLLLRRCSAGSTEDTACPATNFRVCSKEHNNCKTKNYPLRGGISAKVAIPPSAKADGPLA